MRKLKILSKPLRKLTILFTILISETTLLLGCSASMNRSVDTEQKTIITLNKYMDECVKKNNFDGCVLAAQNGKILLDKGYGMADKQQKTINTVQTKFLIASLTKQFTAVAIMQLQEKGLVNVDDTINRYIQDFPHGDKITIHQLLTHTSGLPCDLSDIANFNFTPNSVNEVVKLLQGIDIQLLSEPGAYFKYSDIGYMLLGYIIEKISGKPYESYIEENIFKPLRMDNSGFGYNQDVNKNLALGYDPSGDLVPKDLSQNEAKLLGGAGEIYSTAEDLYKWDRALYTEELISKKSIDKIYTVYKDNYGYGWFIISTQPKKVFQHAGNVSGFTSCITRLVDDNSFVVVLSNDCDGALTRNINNDLTKIICKD